MAKVVRPAGLRPAFTLSKGHPPLLTFEQPDGNSVSLPYSTLRHVRYVPEGVVLLRFADIKVNVLGRNLLPVWSGLRARRVVLLMAATESDGLVRAEYKPHISGIVVTAISRPA
jgi:hypothetical protein